MIISHKNKFIYFFTKDVIANINICFKEEFEKYGYSKLD